MAEHRSQHLKISGGIPEVKKLYNGRFQQEFRCTGFGNKDWYYQNIDTILADFGSLSDAPIVVDGDGGAEPLDISTYPDMRLMHAALEYTPSGTIVVYLDYQTLTSSFVQETEDKVDYELNGLRRVTRPVIAARDTTYSKEVGSSTIDHNEHGYGEVELTLASAVEDNKNPDYAGYTRIIETWVEAGILSQETSNASEGIQQVTTTFLVEEGTTVGPVVSRSISNYEGLRTITVTTMTDADGNSIVEGGENLVNTTSGFSSFTYPGFVNITLDFEGGGEGVNPRGLDVRSLLTKAPAETRVRSTTYFIFQDSNSISEDDYTYDGADGFWSPNHYAAVAASASHDTTDEKWNDSATFRGYRATGESTSGLLEGPLLAYAWIQWQGTTKMSVDTNLSYEVTIDQGPPDPVGNKYVLDIEITPAFDDIDGNHYFKKVITVSDTIPEQPFTASLPYT